MKSTTTLIYRAVVSALLCFSISSTSLLAQMRVGLPTSVPDGSAALEISSGPYSTGNQYRGMAPPKVALTHTGNSTPINKPTVGLLVYNTASRNDLTPGYYYWDGTKWVRFSTINPTSGARVALVNAGDPVPEYTMAQVRSWTTSPTSYSSATIPVFMLVEQGKEGLFAYDPNDTSTPDNTGRVLVTAGGGRYKRIIQGGQIQIEWYGAVGNASTDDTQAIQNAINDALLAANPTINQQATTSSELPRFGRPGTVLVPVGSFRVGSLAINGSIRLIGQGGGTYAGSTFVQRTEGESILLLGPDVDNVSNSTVIENICFKSGSGTSNSSVAQIKATAANSNSVYIRNCWFKSPEAWAIWMQQGDDCQISGCTFDVSPYNAIRLGTQGGGMVTNCTVTNNTFFRISLASIKLENVKGVVISSNRIYSDEYRANTIAINGLSATNINGLTIVGNEYNNMPSFALLPTNTQGVVIANNVGHFSGSSAFDEAGSFLTLVGGGVLYGASIANNSVFAAVRKWISSPITGAGCGLQNSVITGNSFFSGAASPFPAINLSDNRVFSNVIDKNVVTNFTSTQNLVNPALNGLSLSASSNLADLGDKPSARTNLGLGSAATQNTDAFMAVSGGKLVATYSNVFNSTASWTANTYKQVLPPNTLANGTVYLVKIIYNKVGQDQVVQSWIVPISATSASEVGTPTDLSGNVSVYRVSSGRFVKLRQLKGTGTFGLEAAFSQSDMIDGSASLTITTTPLF